eukprot:2321470-Pyramimonas_sp.AAC.1
MDFVVQTQRRCLNHMATKVRIQEQKTRMQEAILEWASEVYPGEHSIRDYITAQGVEYVEAVMRQEMPRAKSKVDKEREQTRKRGEQIHKAEHKYNQMDNKELLATALFEVLGHAKKKSGSGSKRELIVKETDAIGFLLKDHAETAKAHNVKIVPENAMKRRNTPAPSGRRRSTSRPGSQSSRARSTSRASKSGRASA